MSKNAPKNSTIFICEKCDFQCIKLSDWRRHCFTRKHERLTNTSILTDENAPFVCMCNNKYKHRQSLYKHIKYSKSLECKESKKHQPQEQIEETKHIIDENQITTQMFYELMKQNSEFQKGIIDILKQQQPVTTNNNNTIHNNIMNSNSNNKTFNLNVYLNETCKDALNLSEFIDSINVKLSDLENIGQEGYVDGISDLFLTNLNDLDSHMRPIHCSDLRREILYVKNQNEWFKEAEDKPLIIQAIKQLTTKNIRQISEWMKKYPDCTQSDSKKNDQYLKIVSNAMSGGTVEEQKNNINKIIKNLIKEVVINKSIK
jgi:hypothetical protein